MEITEDNVVQQIKNHDERAIAFIIQMYGGLLTAIIKRHVQYNQEDYEECLDDVLLAIWHHIDAFDEGKNTFKQWIATIAKYRAIDYQRRMMRNQRQFISREITDDLFKKQPLSPKQDVEEVLTHLSSTERAIFEKYYLDGVV
ncbi:sigma-70 family RNA polymerase sigma factor [Paenibacillus sp. BR2-3]|uniref:sigma-70 family RNA polymerase sigma factor n=1 Tax=Paenibacillus sp. BR2-3 TaxID=3048494 RepID=UPI00397770B4